MSLYACGIVAQRREPAGGEWKVTTKLAVCLVDAVSEDEALGKAHRIANEQLPPEQWPEGRMVTVSGPGVTS